MALRGHLLDLASANSSFILLFNFRLLLCLSLPHSGLLLLHGFLFQFFINATERDLAYTWCIAFIPLMHTHVLFQIAKVALCLARGCVFALQSTLAFSKEIGQLDGGGVWWLLEVGLLLDSNCNGILIRHEKQFELVTVRVPYYEYFALGLDHVYLFISRSCWFLAVCALDTVYSRVLVNILGSDRKIGREELAVLRTFPLQSEGIEGHHCSKSLLDATPSTRLSGWLF